MNVAVLVQRVEGRPIWERARTAIEASDIGTHYRQMVHPAGMPIDEFFLSTLERLYEEADTELVLRLEDDVVFLNDDILYNAATWPALHDERFGAGWLLAYKGCTVGFLEGFIYKQYGKDVWVNEIICSSACLFWRKDLPAIMEGCREWFAEREPGYGRCFDWALCHAVRRMGKQIGVHAPSLVDHDDTVESTLGNGVTTHTSHGTFRKVWKRGVNETV